MNIEELIKTVKLGYKISRPVLALSSPGIGKSSAVYQAAAQLAAEYKETFEVIEIRASTSNPAELAAIKYIADGEVKEAQQGWVPTKEKVIRGECAERGIVFADEVCDGTPTTQSALQQLLLDQRLGGARLAKGWGTMAASNRVADKAAAGRISSALVNRCITVTINPDISTWAEWAIENNIEPALIAFARWRPNCFDYSTKNQTVNPSFSSPRSFHILSDVMKKEKNPDFEIVTGCLGDGVGSEVFGFLKIMKSLPDLDAITRGLAVNVPTRMDVAIATLYALIARINDKNANNILAYFARNETEIAVSGIRDLIRMRPAAAASQAFRDWAADPRNSRLLTV